MKIIIQIMLYFLLAEFIAGFANWFGYVYVSLCRIFYNL
jgi:hypothetical protein